jgi:hypothetical protein
MSIDIRGGSSGIPKKISGLPPLDAIFLSDPPQLEILDMNTVYAKLQI